MSIKQTKSDILESFKHKAEDLTNNIDLSSNQGRNDRSKKTDRSKIDQNHLFWTRLTTYTHSDGYQSLSHKKNEIQ